MTRDELELIKERANSGNVIFRSGRVLRLLAELNRKDALIAQLLEALKAFMECPERLDEDTVPKRFIGHIEDAPPYQVVVNWSVAYTKVLNARAAIAAAEEAR